MTDTTDHRETTPRREISGKQILRLSQQMLDQQAEINTLRAELAALQRTERERWRWLASTVDLQRDVYGHDWEKIQDVGHEHYYATLGESVRSNVTALIAELGELLQELGPVWKTWVTKPGLTVERRDAAVEEAIDVEHFLANIYVSLGVTDEEHDRRYRVKQEKNATRQRDEGGYDGVTNKCPRCHRSYDGAGVTCQPGGPEYTYADDGTEPVRVIDVRPYCAHVGHYV